MRFAGKKFPELVLPLLQLFWHGRRFQFGKPVDRLLPVLAAHFP